MIQENHCKYDDLYYVVHIIHVQIFLNVNTQTNHPNNKPNQKPKKKQKKTDQTIYQKHYILYVNNKK